MKNTKFGPPFTVFFLTYYNQGRNRPRVKICRLNYYCFILINLRLQAPEKTPQLNGINSPPPFLQGSTLNILSVLNKKYAEADKTRSSMCVVYLLTLENID